MKKSTTRLIITALGTLLISQAVAQIEVSRDKAARIENAKSACTIQVISSAPRADGSVVKINRIVAIDDGKADRFPEIEARYIASLTVSVQNIAAEYWAICHVTKLGEISVEMRVGPTFEASDPEKEVLSRLKKP